MSTIEPGTPVRVIIDGEVDLIADDVMVVGSSAAESRFDVLLTDPAVQVVPVDPERPTLEQVLADHELAGSDDARPAICMCGDGDDDEEAEPVDWMRAHLAEQLRAAGVAL